MAVSRVTNWQDAQPGDVVLIATYAFNDTSRNALNPKWQQDPGWAVVFTGSRYGVRDPSYQENWSLARYTVPSPKPSSFGFCGWTDPSASEYNLAVSAYVAFTGVGGVGRSVSGSTRVQVVSGGAGIVAGMDLNDGALGLTRVSDAGSYLDLHFGLNSGGSSTYIGPSSGGQGTNTGTFCGALELLPVSVPNAPTILQPAQGVQVSSADPVTVRIRHNSVMQGGGSAKAYRLRVRQDGGTWYYLNATAGTISSTTPVTNTIVSATEFEVVLPTLTGTAVDLIAETQESGTDGFWSPASSTRAFSRVAPPTVVVTAGDTVGDLSPTITWVTTTGTGVQETFRVVITSGGETLHDSGEQYGAAQSYTVPESTAWTSAATNTATVTVTQTGGAGASDADTFTVSWTPPTAPTIVATAAAKGVAVKVSTVADRIVRVWRRVDAQPSTVVETLLGVWQTGTHNTVEFVDMFGPVGPATYVAQVWSDLDGILLPSPQALSSAATRTDGRCGYIASALDPIGTWQDALLESEGDRTHVRAVEVVWPIGGTHSRTLSGPRRGVAGSFTQDVITDETLHPMLDLLHSGETLVLRMPADLDGNTWIPGEVIGLSVASEVEQQRTRSRPSTSRRLAWAWVERDIPDPTGSSLAPAAHPVTITTE